MARDDNGDVEVQVALVTLFLARQDPEQNMRYSRGGSGRQLTY